MHDLLLILGMFLVTYSIRYLPFAYAHRVHFPPWLREALSYVPIAALTAIIAPIIIYRDGDLDLSWDNNYLVASCIAMAVAWKSRSALMTVFSGLTVFFILKWALS